MKRLITRLSAVATIGFASLAGAQQPIPMPIPFEPPQIIIPQRPHRHWQPQPVKLTIAGLDVKIKDQISTTTLSLTLHNPSGRPQEAQLVIPVPAGASIKQFELPGLGDEAIARILPKDEARRIYQSIVSTMRDPGLVEFIGYNLIQTSVFPVPEGEEAVAKITYEQVVASDAGRVDYVFPRSESLQGTGVEWTFSADIRSRTPISTVYSPSHDIVTERVDPKHVKVTVAASEGHEPGPFRLSYLTESPQGVSASLMAYPDPKLGDGKGGYFMLLTGLPAHIPEQAKKIKREVTIVIDRSGSMRGDKLAQAREAALQVIEGLKEGERFNIIDYSDTIEKFAANPVAKTDDSIKEARVYLKNLAATGGTNINDALIEALRQETVEGSLPMVLFLTDGLPTIGERSEVAIREAAMKANKHNRRIFTFGVGFDVNAPLLTNLAINSRGAPTFVLPDEDVEVKVGQVYRRLSGPVLASPTLVAVDHHGRVDTRAVRDMLPRMISDQFEGDQLVLLGQYTDEDTPLRLRLEGNYLGQERTFEFTFDLSKASTTNSYVPRLWASRKIGALLDEIRQAAANGGIQTVNTEPDPRTRELVDEVIRLSTEFGILTEYTAFLAVEDRFMDMGGARFDQSPASGGMRMAPGYTMQSLDLARRSRSGRTAVAEESNQKARRSQEQLNYRNTFLGQEFEGKEILTVQQVADQTFFNRANRWIDAALLEHEEEEPEVTIEFASDEYFKLAEELAVLNRQGVLAFNTDVYLMHNNQRVLVRYSGPTE